MSLVSQFYRQIRTYIYNPVYKGPFEYKKKDVYLTKFPFGVSKTKLESEAKEIREIRETPVTEEEISPFHLVWRYKKLMGNPWQHKVILRRLGLHQQKLFAPTVIPNTPHYNQMLWEVKHLIRLKPLKFPNGIPTEEDIGKIQLDTYTGEMKIDARYQIDQEQLDKSKSDDIFTGKYLREYLKWSSGVMGKSLPCHEVKKIDGNRIESFDKQMKDYYKHQHPFYKSEKQ